MRTFRLFSPFILAALVAGCHRDAEQEQTSSPKVEGNKIVFADDASQLASLTVEAAEPRNLFLAHLTGQLYWNDDLTVHIFTPVAGRVSAILADLGQPVSLGTPLAEIDSPDFGQALADARTAKGNLRLTDKTFTRAKELFEHGAAAQKDVENAEAAYISAGAERDRALARLSLYGGSESVTNAVYRLCSPLAGVLVEKNINPGQEVRPDQMLANAPNLFAPLFVVSNPSKLWLQLDVAESDLHALQPGQQLRIYSQAFPDKVFDGTVAVIGDALDPATRTVKVRGVVNNPDKLLKAEMYVKVDVVMNTGQIAAVEIPAKAVFMRDGKYYVFIEQSPGQYQRQVVKPGAEQDGKVPVFDGVNAGQKIVTEGCLLLESLIEAGGKS
jgi:cobalt-zinc-cadmium efflux system membrane fusion protein